MHLHTKVLGYWILETSYRQPQEQCIGAIESLQKLTTFENIPNAQPYSCHMTPWPTSWPTPWPDYQHHDWPQLWNQGSFALLRCFSVSLDNVAHLLYGNPLSSLLASSTIAQRNLWLKKKTQQIGKNFMFFAFFSSSNHSKFHCIELTQLLERETAPI